MKRIQEEIMLNQIERLSRIKRKQHLWSNYIRTKDGQVYQEYCTVRNQVRRLTRKAHKIYEKSIAKQVKKNPKAYWKYAHSKMKIKSGIPSLYKDSSNSSTATNDKENADILAEYFQSVFTKEDLSKPLPNLIHKTLKRLTN